MRKPSGQLDDFSHRKVRALLAYLAVQYERPQTREHLASVLWARTGDERARHNLRQALSKIRALSPDLLITPDDRIALNSKACDIDVVAFQELARSEGEGDMRQALALYRGDLLEGYVTSEAEFQDWLDVARVRLRKLACELAGRLSAVLHARGATAESIDVLHRLLDLDRANESAHRRLMQLLAATGKRSEALRQYQECAAALAQELGAKPGPETRKLRDALSQGSDASALDAGSTSDASATQKAVILATEDAALNATSNAGNQSQFVSDVLTGLAVHHHGELVLRSKQSLLAKFDVPEQALACAMALQDKLGVKNSNPAGSGMVSLRVGIAEGRVAHRQGELCGDAVNMARRLQTLAEPGGICISDSIRASTDSTEKAGFQFIGEQRAPEVEQPFRAYHARTATAPTFGASPLCVSTPAIPLPGKPSIIIKPFENMSADKEQDYFAEGLTKDISIALTKIPGLFLAEDATPRGRYSEGKNASELGRDFGVRYVLSGGVRKAGSRVRVNAELIDTMTGHCLWGERYDRELHDLFAIQDEITEEIVTAMDIKLVQGEGARFMRKALTNPAALEASYRGWYALYNATGRQDVLEAQHLFEEVIRLQPEAAIGYASAALAHWAEAGFGRIRLRSKAMSRAVEFAHEALALGDTTGYAHLVLAVEHLARHEYAQAMAQATEGVAERPNCNGAYAIKSMVLNYLGEPREAIEYAQYAVRLTPVYPAEYPAVLAASYHDAERHAEAIAAAEASLKLRGDDIDPLLILIASHVALGDLSAASVFAEKVKRLDPDFHLIDFAETQPYKNPRDRDRLIGRLREAGLPD